MRATYADALEIVGVRHVHRLGLAGVDRKTGHLVADGEGFSAGKLVLKLSLLFKFKFDYNLSLAGVI